MRASTVTNLCHNSGPNSRASARNTQISCCKALPLAGLPQPEFKLKPPIVAAQLLTGNEIGFLEFLTDPAVSNYCEILLGGEMTSAATMLREFRKAIEFHYFGYRRAKSQSKNSLNLGKLTAPVTATKSLLKKYARLAYRGDPERRGVAFWERVAWLVWNCYATLMALRCRAETIRQQELKRMASLPAKRTARAEYMRGYRARRQEKQRAKAARYVTTEAKGAWRQQRSQTRKGEVR